MRNVIRARQRILGAFLLGLSFAVFWSAGTARAQQPPPELSRATTTGFDISWPQCGGPYPAQPLGFGIVGVTGGKPFTENRCLADQWRWARTGQFPPEVYINLDYWRKTSYLHFFGPAGLCPTTDPLCQAHNYGWQSAKDAPAYGRSQGVDTNRWWLDVETMNYWSEDTAANAKIIEGAIDYFKSARLQIGIYSTPYQWGVIAGDYAPKVPVWTAGATSLEGARARCDNPRYAFAGGRVELVQWVEQFDMNYACP